MTAQSFSNQAYRDQLNHVEEKEPAPTMRKTTYNRIALAEE